MSDDQQTHAQLRAEVAALRAQVAHYQANDEGPDFRQLVEQGQGLLCTHDFEGKLLYVNPAAAQRLGYTQQELIATNLRDLLVPTVRARFDDYLTRIRQQGADQGFLEFLTKAGERHVWHYHNICAQRDGPPLYVIGFALDVTAQVATQQSLKKARNDLDLQVQEQTAALRASELRYRKLFDNANDIIAIFTPDGVITHANRSAEVHLGWTRAEMVGRHYRAFSTPETVAAVEERIRRFASGEKPTTNLEVEMLRKDRSSAVFEGRTRPIRDRHRTLIGFQAIFRDITERKRAEGKLRQATAAAEAANRAKSEFLSTMSHEFRTPLNVVLGYTDLLFTGTFGPLREAQEGALHHIRQGTTVLIDLINNVLDLNRLDAGRLPLERRVVRIDTLVKEIEQETRGLRDLSGLSFHWKIERTVPLLQTDPGKLKVILKNLLSNAIKFTEAGDVTLAASAAREGIAISVTDTGIGIPPAQQSVIFEAFRQGDNTNIHGLKGVGLGLHIVTRLLDLLDGTIEVESEVGRGSTFRVWLPVKHQ
jgi:PAS domain S-box-containing protein